jgi:hypothetical protein
MTERIIEIHSYHSWTYLLLSGTKKVKKQEMANTNYPWNYNILEQSYLGLMLDMQNDTT